jgi:penicillin-binding protein 1A
MSMIPDACTGSLPPAHRRPDFEPWPERRWRGVLRGMLWAALVLAALAVAGAAWLWIAVWNGTPPVSAIEARLASRPSRIVSSDGVVLQVLDDKVLEPVTLDQVAPALRDALIATEDRRFFDHAGIDPRRIVGSALATAQGDLQGGSTLTQQLARNLFPEEVGNRRSLMRKLREMAVALKLEQRYDKQQLLGFYLNQVPYLYNVAGVGAASRTYFAKPASALAPREAALLVAMLKGPAQYDPERFPARALARRNLVLVQMARTGRLDAATLRAEVAQPLGVTLHRGDIAEPPAPHFLRLVRQQFNDWAVRQGLDPQRDGLTVHVSLDTRQQALAEQAVARQTALLQRVAESEWSRAELRAGPGTGAIATPFAQLWRSRPDLLDELVRATPAYQAAAGRGAPPAEALAAALQDPALRRLQAQRTRLEAGFVAMDPTTGAVRAHVGSRDFALDRFDHVTQARRQPGSTFKPFVYGAALLDGMSPERPFVDQVIQYPTAQGGVWAPADAGGASGTWMSLRTGLARSRNTITAQVMQQVGPTRVVRLAQAMGVDRSPLQPVPSLALGTSPVTLLEMVNAYGTLAALGERRAPVFIERIDDRHGQTLFAADNRPARVLDEGHAAQLVDMLRDAVDVGTGRLLRTQFSVKGDVAGKTGTTQHNTDGWFIALHPSLVVGVWVGFNDQRVTMRSTEWGQGGRSALRLAGDFLAAMQRDDRMPLQARFPAVQHLPEPQPLLTDDPPSTADAPSDAPSPATPPADPPAMVPVLVPALVQQVVWQSSEDSSATPHGPQARP